MSDDRLAQQIAFLIEADKLKNIIRRTPLMDSSRRENSAEHSWHLVVAAMVLYEYSADEVDLLRVLEMLAVHDLVEIDAGDTFAYDVQDLVTKAERELAAADRVFALLPPDQASRLRLLWEEFEAHATPDARFANAMDRLQPLLQNACAQGGSWRDHDVDREQVLSRMAPIQSAAPAAWPLVLKIVDDFCASGLLRAAPTSQPST
ncbi:MAG: HD domain-containing protein [Vicinamibacterales bacterium]